MALRIQSIAELPPAVRALNDPRREYEEDMKRMYPQWAAREDAKIVAALMSETAKKPKRKYNNIPVTEDGQRFDSKLELRCYQWLKLRQLAGEVLWFIRQVSFRLEGGVVCRVDYVAQPRAGRAEVIDAKGMLTQSSANKYKQMKDRYGIDVILWKDK
jgi:hypothetical protein